MGHQEVGSALYVLGLGSRQSAADSYKARFSVVGISVAVKSTGKLLADTQGALASAVNSGGKNRHVRGCMLTGLSVYRLRKGSYAGLESQLSSSEPLLLPQRT